ncbi:putativechitin synthase [Fistulina hepatica ATCC 64428]|uniref:Chitin synthase n=1 Tax=Fistulina hepatica ATCC 64428 TaxID=1128425 RepID=A0A0D7AIQ6_9AGAR|nr:putativechitin synthase [Fistulina hepatica ATCC 64428]
MLFDIPTVDEASSDIDIEWRRRQAIRRGIKRRLELTKGHFIAEYDVPTAIKNAVEPQYIEKRNTTEFTHMRYTAATCDPDDFTEANGWSLRTKQYGRDTEILVAVTSYNEDKALYARTLHGVMKNVRDICKTRKSKYWQKSAEEGTPGWQKITIALIADGLEAMDKSVLDILATVGVYQDGIMKKKIDGNDTVAHIFEYTTQIAVDHKPDLILPQPNDPNNMVPVQIIFILKQQNQKKINSHRWLFNAIGRMLEPEICILIDAGTKPGHKSIYHLWRAFYNDPNLGGCCGEIHAMIKGGRKLLNPLVAAQNFEYKMSNILGNAIQGRPLEQYFHGDHSLADRLGDKGINGMSIFTKNMFLAEDRILCFELVAKKGCRWTLTYVKPSKAETDVPESAAELISQRRRWLNGSFAASVYSLIHFPQYYQTSHHPIRMFFLHVQALYNIAALILTWFALGNLWLTFSIIIDLLGEQGYIMISMTFTHWFNQTAKWIYLACLFVQFIMALGNRPKSERLTYTITLWIYAVLSVYLLVCSLFLTVTCFVHVANEVASQKAASDIISTFFSSSLGPLVAALVSTFGIYLVASLLYGDPYHMLFSFPQYMCLAPSFTNVLNVYAFCNLHDVSWGTKGSDRVDALPSVTSRKSGTADAAIIEDTTKIQEDIDATFQETVTRALTALPPESTVVKRTQDDENKTFRTRLVLMWVFSNAGLALAVENLNGWLDLSASDISKTKIQEFNDEYDARRSRYFSVLLYSTFALSLVRFIGFMFYWLRRNLFRCCRRN